MNKSTLAAVLSAVYDATDDFIWYECGYDDPDCAVCTGGNKADFIALMTGPAEGILAAFEGLGYAEICAADYIKAVASGDKDNLGFVNLMQLACEFKLGSDAVYFNSWLESEFSGKTSYMKLWDFLLSRADILINNNQFEVGDFDHVDYLLGLFVEAFGWNINVCQDTVLAAMRGDEAALKELDDDIVRFVTE